MAENMKKSKQFLFITSRFCAPNFTVSVIVMRPGKLSLLLLSLVTLAPEKTVYKLRVVLINILVYYSKSQKPFTLPLSKTSKLISGYLENCLFVRLRR